MRWCWVNFQCRGVLLLWKIVGQGPTALVVGAGGSCLDIFSLVYHFSFLSLSLWETAQYRLKYCLKGPLSPKQPTNQPIFFPQPVENNSTQTAGRCSMKVCLCQTYPEYRTILGPVVQSILSLNSSLRGQLIKCFTTL